MVEVFAVLLGLFLSRAATVFLDWLVYALLPVFLVGLVMVRYTSMQVRQRCNVFLSAYIYVYSAFCIVKGGLSGHFAILLYGALFFMLAQIFLLLYRMLCR